MSNLETTPHLRFSEFNKKWRPTKLVDHTTSVIYGMNSSAIKYDGKHGYIRITDIDEDNCFSPSPITSPDGLIEEKFKLNDCDIVFARTGANTGKSYLYKEADGEIYFAGFLIKASIINANPEFIFQNTFRQHYDNWVYVMSMRSGQPGINAEEYKSFSFNIPEYEEQQKIANFLSAVDKKTSLLKEKYALLEQYKKGVMQKLFSQEIRFKDKNGNEFSDWKEERFSDVLVLQLNSLKMKDDAKYELITVRRRNGGVDSRGIFEGKDVLVKNQFVLKTNQFVISKRQIVHGACGLVPEKLAGAIVSNEYNVFDPVFEKLDINYFNMIATTLPMRRAFFINSDGVHIEKLLFKTQSWLKTKMEFPCVEEQKKIICFIESLNKKIELVSKQIELTQTFKKGLLQQMFV